MIKTKGSNNFLTEVAEEIVRIETGNLRGRLLTGLLLVAALVFAWFSVSWQIGNMFASLTSPNDPNARQIAEFAYDLSPRDPLTNWLMASVEKEVYSPENLARAATSYEAMIRRAPVDYRYWIELGRWLEQAERYDDAEKAFRRAAELAPNYSAPLWHIGNFYLRQGREGEAFEHLRRSAELNPEASAQFFALVWDYYQQDAARLESLVGDKNYMRASLARFYAAKERAAESLRVWNTLTEEEKQAHAEVARIIAQALYEKQFYRSAVEYVRQLKIEPQAAAETVQNGGFEASYPDEPKNAYFNWKVQRIEKVEVRADAARKKEGNRSLRVTFNGFAGVELKNVGQIVAVEPNKKYALSFWLKTENLKSAGAPVFEVVNASDQKIIASSGAFPSGTNEWAEIKIDFAAPDNSEAVVIRLDRAYCGDACPIAGTVWLDEFRLAKL